MPSRRAPRDLRASDADRELVVSLLGEAVVDGRLTAEEHAERLEQASTARTLGDLAGLTTDLAGPEAQPVRLDGTRPVLAVFGSQQRDGRWVVPERLTVTAILGEAVIDFRNALLQTSRITLYTTVLGGRLRLLVPDGVDVEVTGSGASSRQRRTVPQQPPGPGEPPRPVIEVRGMMVWGRVQVVTPPKSRFLGIFPRRGR
ncbi:MAG TPA: DUF1707 domain-containing protein [Streptosporangiaceae bacterium]